MFTVIFINAVGVIDKQACEHMGLSLTDAAVDDWTECNPNLS
jgi:hypothetical protein